MDSSLLIARIIIGIILFYISYLLYNKYSYKLNKTVPVDPSKNCWIKNGYGYGYGTSNPSSGLIDLIKIFGQPAIIDSKEGGFARWTKEQLLGKPFEQIEIRDQQIPHSKPTPHSDFLYTWYKIDIPSHKLPFLHHISHTIIYDSDKKMMLTRCHDIRSNVIIQWIVKNYVDDQITTDEAAGIFGPMYQELLKDHTKYHELELEL